MPRLLRFHELCDYGVPFGRRWVDQLEAAGRFPRRIKIGERAVGWAEAEITQYAQELIQLSRPKLAPKKRDVVAAATKKTVARSKKTRAGDEPRPR